MLFLERRSNVVVFQRGTLKLKENFTQGSESYKLAIFNLMATVELII